MPFLFVGESAVKVYDCQSIFLSRYDDDFGAYNFFDSGDTLVIEKGSIHLLRYQTIEELLARAEVELI